MGDRKPDVEHSDRHAVAGLRCVGQLDAPGERHVEVCVDLGTRPLHVAPRYHCGSRGPLKIGSFGSVVTGAP